VDTSRPPGIPFCGIRNCRAGSPRLTHLPDIVPEIDRVVMMRKERIFRDGRKAEVLREGPLSERFGIPCEVLERGGYYHVL
jgi:hypothetical protein